MAEKRLTPRPATKSSTAFRTISEVAADVGVQQHVLRFWETRFPQIEPIKRGGNRRYYRPADVDLLKQISRLLYQDGYTIKGVQQLLGRTDGGERAAGPDVIRDGVPAARSPRPTQARPIAIAEMAEMPALAAIRAQLAAALAAARAL